MAVQRRFCEIYPDSTQRLVIRHLLWLLNAETLPFTAEPMRGIGLTSLLLIVTNFIPIPKCMGRTLLLRAITWWAHYVTAIGLMFTSWGILSRWTSRTTAHHSPCSMNVEGREGNPERKRRAPCSVLNHKPSNQEDEDEDEEGYPGRLLKWGGCMGRFLLALLSIFWCMLGEHLCEKHQNKIIKDLPYRRQHQHMQSPNHYPKPLAISCWSQG